MGAVKVTRVVIDTNVVVSALLFGGTPGKLISLWKEGRIKAFISKEIIDEYLRVLAYPRFNLSEMEIDYLLYQEILPYFEITKIKSGPIILEKDPPDDKFIYCAQASDSKIIISGDQHLLSMKKYGLIEILSPAQVIKRFR